MIPSSPIDTCQEPSVSPAEGEHTHRGRAGAHPPSNHLSQITLQLSLATPEALKGAHCVSFAVPSGTVMHAPHCPEWTPRPAQNSSCFHSHTRSMLRHPLEGHSANMKAERKTTERKTGAPSACPTQGTSSRWAGCEGDSSTMATLGAHKWERSHSTTTGRLRHTEFSKVSLAMGSGGGPWVPLRSCYSAQGTTLARPPQTSVAASEGWPWGTVPGSLLAVEASARPHLRSRHNRLVGLQ